MPCLKSDLISAINSYAAARVTGDGPLMQMAADKLTAAIETLEFAAEVESEIVSE